jgi:hypothetical protein
MTTTEVTTAVTETQAVGDTILTTVGTLDPAVAIPVAAAGTILDLLAKMVSKALTAYGAASGTPITTATIEALLPNATPLTKPTS